MQGDPLKQVERGAPPLQGSADVLWCGYRSTRVVRQLVPVIPESELKGAHVETAP